MTDTPVSQLVTPLLAGQTAEGVLLEHIRQSENKDFYKKPATATDPIHSSPGDRVDIGWGYDIKAHSLTEIKAALTSAAGADLWTRYPKAEAVLQAYKSGNKYDFSDGKEPRIPVVDDLSKYGPQLTKAEADNLALLKIRDVAGKLDQTIVLGESWERVAALDLGYNMDGKRGQSPIFQ